MLLKIMKIVIVVIVTPILLAIFSVLYYIAPLLGGLFVLFKWTRGYGVNVLIGVDQLIGSVLGGDPDETISSRFGKGAREGNWFSIAASWYLDFFDKNHSEKSVEEDEGGRSVFFKNE